MAYYYDSKSFLSNLIYPSSTTINGVCEGLGVSEEQLDWNDINFDHQALSDRETCGYHTYKYCSELFLTGRIDPEPLTSDEIKSLFDQQKLDKEKNNSNSQNDKLEFIKTQLNEIKPKTEELKDDFYEAANQFYQVIIDEKNNNNPGKLAAINVLYQFMLMPKDKRTPHTCGHINAYQQLFEGKIKNLAFCESAARYYQKTNWGQALAGAMLILIGVVILALTIKTLLTAGLSLPLLGITVEASLTRLIPFTLGTAAGLGVGLGAPIAGLYLWNEKTTIKRPKIDQTPIARHQLNQN